LPAWDRSAVYYSSCFLQESACFLACVHPVAAKKMARQRKMTTDFWFTTAKLIFAVGHSFFTHIPPEPSCLMFYFCTQ
jgi:hypothetical protein